MNAWLERHLQTLVGSLGRLSQQPLPTLLTILVMGIALALPACLGVLVKNAQQVSGDWDRALDMSVYLRTTVDAEVATRLANKLKQRSDVAAVQLIWREQALEEFRAHSGFGEALGVLKDNPLPHLLVVTPRASGAEQVQAMANDIGQWPEVDVVQVDTAWVQRYLSILDAIKELVNLIGMLLALGVMVIVGNTIRLDIQNRRDEIEVTKLVGGSDAFVRRPFLYAGVWYGLGGGLFAWLTTGVMVLMLAGPISRIASLYGSRFSLSGLGLSDGLSLIAGGVLLGWLGSYVATTRHLRDIEPR